MKDMKAAIVTGGATGIGKACVERLAADGYSIVLSYRSRKDEAESLLKSLPGENHLGYQGDISDPAQVQNLVETTIKKLGKIDVLVNSAGVFSEHDITKISYDDWQSSWEYNIRVNLIAPMNLCFCVARKMAETGKGKIINISSRGAFRGEPDAPAYGASKSGLNSASQSLSKALASSGISVFAIAPGWINTPLAAPYLSGPSGDQIRSQSPLNRVGEPHEIAHLVSFLAADGSEYLTGAIFDANGASYFRN
jgi:3-oxoacyl-[acyl-carrier protein] reductase